MLVEGTQVEGEQTQDPSAPNGQTTTPNGQTPNGNPQQKTEVNTLPPDIQDYIKRLRKEAETANDALKTVKAAEEKAEQERLVKQGEWQKLAETAQTEVSQLKPQVEQLTGRYKQLSDLVLDGYKAETKDWPKEVKDLLPGENADALEWAEALKKYRPLTDKLKGQSQGAGGNGQRPRPQNTGPAGEAAEIEALKARMRAGGRY